MTKKEFEVVKNLCDSIAIICDRYTTEDELPKLCDEVGVPLHIFKAVSQVAALTVEVQEKPINIERVYNDVMYTIGEKCPKSFSLVFNDLCEYITPSDREYIELYYGRGLNYSQIATIKGVSTGMVCSYIKGAISRLKILWNRTLNKQSLGNKYSEPVTKDTIIWNCDLSRRTLNPFLEDSRFYTIGDIASIGLNNILRTKGVGKTAVNHLIDYFSEHNIDCSWVRL